MSYPQLESSSKSALGGFHDLSGGLARLRQVGLLRNPFDPNAREAPENRPARQETGTQSRRPTFRRSIVLQQIIARRERFAAACEPRSLQMQMEARPAGLQPAGGTPSSYLRPVFGLGQIQDSQHA